MAVETRHFNLFPPQLIGNSDLIGNGEGNANMFSIPSGYGFSASGTTTETLLPMFGSALTDSYLSGAAMNSESGLTYSINPPVSRKRSRDSFNPLLSIPNHVSRCASFTFLGEDVTSHIQQQQLDIDCFIAQHTEKVILEIEELRKRNSRRILAAVEEGIMKKLRVKEAEMEKIGRLNWALEEKVKSLYVENQIWRELAQTSEATANALRSNLEMALAQVQDEAGAVMEDAQSCCGSNYGGELEEEKDGRMLAGAGNRGERSVVNDKSSEEDGNRWCRKCRKEESCVLLLPCRHLCLCSVCGSSAHTCPVCNSTKTASLLINMSS